jgi:hypothetical protein
MNAFNKKFLTVILFTFLIMSVSAQYVPELPKILEPSPQSKAFMRYGDYPMNGNTGLVDISVPLHEIRAGQLNVPLSMSFHASGRMANEINGILGMRWTLNCGGLVTRNMKGRPDEYESVTPLIVNPDVPPTFETLYNSCVDGYNPSDLWHTSLYDSEFDIFNYSLPNGKSGHFILKNENGTKVPMLIPFSPLKITMLKDASYYNYFRSIEIVDTDGTKYIFGGASVYNNTGYIESSTENPHPGMQGSIPTAWYLTKIISADEKDEMAFSYMHKMTTQRLFSESLHNADRLRDNSLIPSNDPIDPYWSSLSTYLYEIPLLEASGYTTKTYYTPLLTAVTFNGGSLNFSYRNTLMYSNSWVLDEIAVNGENSLLKKIKLTLSLHPKEKDIYYLNKVQILGRNGDPNGSHEAYNFDYYVPETSPTDEIISSDGSSRYRDWWGYYNNSVNEHTLISQQISILRPHSGGNEGVIRNIGYNTTREAKYSSKVLGMLKSITFPTGGQTEFVYEDNRYDFAPYYQPITNPSTLSGPGLRVKEMISKPVIGNNIYKHYKYGGYEDGRGFLNQYLKPDANSLASSLSCLEGTVMHYWNWLEYGQSYHPDQAGHRTRDYLSETYLKFDLGRAPIIYDAVSEYYEENGVLNNKTVSNYNITYPFVKDFIVNDQTEQLYFIRKFADPDNAWEKSLLTSKYYFKKVNDLFEITRSEDYGYDYVEKGFAWDMPTYRHGTVVIGYTGPNAPNNLQTKYNKEKEYHENTCSLYGYGYRRYSTGFQNPTGVIVKDYTPQGIVTSSRLNTLDPVTSLVRSETVTDSKGIVKKTEYSYAFDRTGGVYATMVSKNIIEPVVQKDFYTGSVFQQSERTTYQDWGNNIIAPSLVETNTALGGSYEPRVAFNAYDTKGNLTSFSKYLGPGIVYLYSYRSARPIAEIRNADYATVVSLLGGAPAVTAFSALVSPDKTAIDNFLQPLRDNLPQAFISSYVYRPLEGMVSQTDAKGMTTYYEYDNLQRLQAVKDHNGHFVKTYCYNYAGQVIDCNGGGGTVPSGPVQMYARIEVLNPTWSAPVDGSTTEADIYLALYSDAACTVPVFRPQPFDVNVSTTGTYFENNISSVSSWTNSYSVPANANRVLLGRYVTDSWYSYNDPWYGQMINSYNYTYRVEANGAGIYIPSATY